MPRGRAMVAAVFAALLVGVASSARGDTLDDIKARGTLVWGADQEGGGPYVYPDPADPARIVGFEVELAELLAGELHVKAELKQCDWKTLPEFLRTGKIDIILNGYEWTASRAKRMRASRPYYIYQLQLLARETDASISSWDDLRQKEGRPQRSVSVLGESAACSYMQEHWSGQVRIFEYEGNTDSMSKVRDGGHDATVQDLPIAVFYSKLPQGRGLKFVGEPIDPEPGQRGYYVIYARPEDGRLVAALDGAIEKGLRSGRLRGIYEKYGIWNKAQEELLANADPARTSRTQRVISDASGSQPGNFLPDTPDLAIPSQITCSSLPATGLRAIGAYGPTLLQAAGMTLLLSVCAMPLAILIGLLVALGRLYGPGLVRWPLGVYVEVLRGTPVMLQLYVIYFVLPGLLHVNVNPIVAGILGLAINYSAYEAEIYRAGLQAIPRGQMEAALALGLSRRTALFRIIVPQAVRIVVPAVTNDFIALFKDTSVCSVIAVIELTKSYNMLANSTGSILELAGMTAVLYLVMSYPLSVVAGRLERRMEGGRG